MRFPSMAMLKPSASRPSSPVPSSQVLSPSSSSSSSPVPKPKSRKPNFDIDTYLNPFIPRPRLYLLPRPLSHILGYRPPSSIPSSPLSTSLTALSAFLGAFISISLITLIFRFLPPLPSSSSPPSDSDHAINNTNANANTNTNTNPLIIASLGATAILEFNAINSPLAQPRAVLLGQLLSTTIGILTTKLLSALLPPSGATSFDELRWLAGALSVGASSAAMTLTKSVHPPAGATALLASSSREMQALGWWLLALVELGSCVMVVVGLGVNNLTGRAWPRFWWTELLLLPRAGGVGDVEGVEVEAAAAAAVGVGVGKGVGKGDVEAGVGGGEIGRVEEEVTIGGGVEMRDSEVV